MRVKKKNQDVLPMKKLLILRIIVEEKTSNKNNKMIELH